MLLEEFWYRLKERLYLYFNSESRATRLIARFLALGFFAAIVSTLAPTLADELANSPSMQEPQPIVQATPSSEPTMDTQTAPADPTPTPTPTPEPSVIRPSIPVASQTPLAEAPDSPTATIEPSAPLKVQPKYVMQIPTSVAVDPRATSAFIPHINAFASGAEFTLACVNAPSASLDILTKRATTTSPAGPDFILGDRSNQLLISGETSRVIALINSYGGLFVSNGAKAVMESSLQMRFVAVNRPVLQAEFCAQARSMAEITFRSLGIGQSTVKGEGSLKR